VPETLGRYELIAEIGRGGMADVKLAMQRGPAGFEKLVVLKLVHEALASDKQIVDMLLDEAKLSALIKHPNVVDVYELGEADGRYFIAMEYLEGEPLLSVLDRGISNGKRLDPLSMARIIADTAEGLDAAHVLKSRDGKPLNLVHHDISLGNIFVLYSGQVKLLDFGVAKVARKSAQKSDKVFGKLAYMAPEKLDERPGDRRSDIWSLGCVLWEALTFKRLFKGANDTEIVREVRYVNVPPPSSVNSEVPAELDEIVLKALQRDPFRRYQTAKELASGLEVVLSQKGYPSKNFQIGGYMMQTFADVIAARERLLREVAGPHRPSAEVIDAAFGDAKDKKESSLPVFDLDHLLEPSNQIVLPEGSTGADLAFAMPGAVPPSAVVSVPDTLSTTSAVMEVPGAAPPQSAAVSVANAFDDEQGVATGYVAPAVHDDADELDESPDGRRRLIPYAIGGGVIVTLVLMIVAIKSCGGNKQTEPVAKAVAPVAPIASDAAVVAVVPDAAPVPEVVIAIDAGAPEEIEMHADDKPAEDNDNDKDKPRPRPTKSAQQLYAEGLKAWQKKDAKKAYALFTEGRRASSTYANNWYGLGLVHEKAGRKRDARTAYERYLKLAPKAPNAGKLRDHIKKNLM